MVRGFSDQEKERIKAALLEKGAELFSRYGLKKTSIADLTRAVGVAQGSFYLFFCSKEELYFEIMEVQELKLREQFMNQFFSGPLTQTVFKDFIKQALHILETNPLLKRLFIEEEFETLFRKLPPEKIARHIQKDEDVLLPLIRRWQKDGLIIDERPEVLSGLLRSLFAIPLQKKMIGTEIYDAVIDRLANCIAAGLIKNGGLRQ